MIKKSINKILALADATLVRRSNYQNILKDAASMRKYRLSERISPDHYLDYFENLKLSKSQLRQDLFVLSELNFKKDGYFIEFGASDGVRLSNTHLLETKFGWSGILAEPARIWHSALKVNRSAIIETDCVWSETGKSLIFNEVNDEKHRGELSTIDIYSNSDKHKKIRQSAGKKYNVKTISLLDLLEKHEAPRSIDYLSIDTEGSEYEILKNFDFEKYHIKVITCEHNYTATRQSVKSLLEKNGYTRKYEDCSLFDDWYVKLPSQTTGPN